MPRKHRQLEDDGIYHVFNRGNNRHNLFSHSVDFEHFKDLMLTIKTELRIDIYHYCLMDNHFHLLLRILNSNGLPRFMHKLQLGYARYYKTRFGYQGHVFQERYKSPKIPKESYYLQCGRYIERNPLTAGLVKEAYEYPYSSARYYALGEENPLVTANLYYEQMGNTPYERQNTYRDFLKLEEPYADLVAKELTLV